MATVDGLLPKLLTPPSVSATCGKMTVQTDMEAIIAI